MTISPGGVSGIFQQITDQEIGGFAQRAANFNRDFGLPRTANRIPEPAGFLPILSLPDRKRRMKFAFLWDILPHLLSKRLPRARIASNIAPPTDSKDV